MSNLYKYQNINKYVDVSIKFNPVFDSVANLRCIFNGIIPIL